MMSDNSTIPSTETTLLTILPPELLIRVIVNLPLSAIGRLCRTSRELNSTISSDEYIWQQLFRRDISTHAVPINQGYKARYIHACQCLANDNEYSRLSNLLSCDYDKLFRTYLPQVKLVPDSFFLTDIFIKAVRYGRFDAIELLIKRGADPNQGVKTAARMGRQDILELLQRSGVDLKSHGGTILTQVADGAGNMAMIDLAFSLGSPQQDDIDVAIQSATGRGHSQIVRRLLPLSRQRYINNSLILAAHSGHVEIIDLLLPQVTDPLILYRALRRAYRKYYNVVARRLVAAGATWFNPLGDDHDEDPNDD
jgi:hypothetical protein